MSLPALRREEAHGKRRFTQGGPEGSGAAGSSSPRTAAPRFASRSPSTSATSALSLSLPPQTGLFTRAAVNRRVVQLAGVALLAAHHGQLASQIRHARAGVNSAPPARHLRHFPSLSAADPPNPPRHLSETLRASLTQVLSMAGQAACMMRSRFQFSQAPALDDPRAPHSERAPPPRARLEASPPPGSRRRAVCAGAGAVSLRGRALARARGADPRAMAFGGRQPSRRQRDRGRGRRRRGCEGGSWRAPWRGGVDATPSRQVVYFLYDIARGLFIFYDPLSAMLCVPRPRPSPHIKLIRHYRRLIIFNIT